MLPYSTKRFVARKTDLILKSLNNLATIRLHFCSLIEVLEEAAPILEHNFMLSSVSQGLLAVK